MNGLRIDYERVAWSISASLRLRYLRVRRKQLRRRANFTNVRLPTGNIHLGFDNATMEGTATLVFRYWGVVDGKFVEDEARQNLTAIAPPINTDVNHDGKMDLPTRRAGRGARRRARNARRRRRIP